ncbi:Serine endoprotease DegS [invertebrate metagenome]|uniref:Serine endoprotease DegS n=1 Tax=invertebrate metagenome TaxID=1711999 RepID=A0A2H9TCB4_9ZZZZ
MSGCIVGFIALFVQFRGTEAFWGDPWHWIQQQVSLQKNSYSYAVKKAAPAVVNIAARPMSESRRNSLYKRPGEEKVDGASLGSGVIVSPDGVILTNHHVIQDARQIVVGLRDGREFFASVVGTDPETDLAVLKIKINQSPFIHLADSSKQEVGDVVLAIGNPFGLGQTVTMGIISATGRDDLQLNTYEDFIQTDAAINIGNSGGALVNASGDLIGISTLLFSSSGGNDGIGFAIPSRMAQFVKNSILKYGTVVRGWLGIESQSLTVPLAKAYGVKRDVGILVTGVYTGGPADKAGLRRGDVLTAINHKNTRDGRKVMNMVAQELPGSLVTLSVIRDDKPMDIQARVTTRPTIVNE